MSYEAFDADKVKHVPLAHQRRSSLDDGIDLPPRPAKVCGFSIRTVGIAAGLFVLAVVAVVLIVVLLDHNSTSKPDLNPSQRACLVFCHGPILHAVQMAALYADAKTFVDMPLKIDPEDALTKFGKLGAHPTHEQISEFVNTTFDACGSDVLQWTPTDYTDSPAMVNHIVNTSLAQWALDVNKLWLLLGRQVAPDVIANPQRHSLLPLPKPTIVPGGRFRETYYWDTYWIVKGLIACDMLTTAKYLIINLLAEASINGYVPNGARVYYLQRSQPPMLTLIINEYYAATGDLDIIRTSMPQLQTAHEWWMETGEDGRAVEIPNPSVRCVGAVLAGCGGARASRCSLLQDPSSPYVLNRYVGTVSEPRPESYTEDMNTASVAGYPEKSPQRGELFRQLRAAAETGWDFSSRCVRLAVSLRVLSQPSCTREHALMAPCAGGSGIMRRWRRCGRRT